MNNCQFNENITSFVCIFCLHNGYSCMYSLSIQIMPLKTYFHVNEYLFMSRIDYDMSHFHFTEIPTVNIITQNVTDTIGSDVAVRCSITSTLAFTGHWFKDGSNVAMTSSGGVTISSDQQSSTLRITSIKESDEGTYRFDAFFGVCSWKYLLYNKLYYLQTYF